MSSQTLAANATGSSGRMPSTSNAWSYRRPAYSLIFSASPASFAETSFLKTGCFALSSSTRWLLGMPSASADGSRRSTRSISSESGPSVVMQAGASVRRAETATFLSPKASFIAVKSDSFSLVASSASFFSSSVARSRSPVATFLSSKVRSSVSGSAPSATAFSAASRAASSS